MPQAGVSVSPGRTHRGDEGPDTDDRDRAVDRHHASRRPVRAVPARLASMAEVTAELDFTPRPRARRTSGPVTPRSTPRPVAADGTSRPVADDWTSRPVADDWTSRPVADERTSRPVAVRAAAATTTASPLPARPFDLDSAAERPVARTGAPGSGVTGRRTVTIQGRPAERYSSAAHRRRPTQRPHERDGFRPDRVAMWAVMLGFVLVLVAATSSHAAMTTHRVADAQRGLVRVHRATHAHVHATAHVHAAARHVALRAR